MPVSGEHKTVQARILKYAQEIGWTYVPRDEAERRAALTRMPRRPRSGHATSRRSLGTCCTRKLARLIRNTKTQRAVGGEFQRLHADIYGNRDFLNALRNQHKFFCSEENRELDLTLIDYDDVARSREQWRNVYEVTEEFYTHNGKHGTREDVVFLINGIRCW